MKTYVVQFAGASASPACPRSRDPEARRPTERVTGPRVQRFGLPDDQCVPEARMNATAAALVERLHDLTAAGRRRFNVVWYDVRNANVTDVVPGVGGGCYGWRPRAGRYETESRAWRRSARRSSTVSMPTERRTSAPGTSSGEPAADACVIRPGCSMSDSTAPSDSASVNTARARDQIDGRLLAAARGTTPCRRSRASGGAAAA